MHTGDNNQLWVFSGSSDLPWICSRLQWGGWTASSYRWNHEPFSSFMLHDKSCHFSWLFRSKLCQVWRFWGWSLRNALPRAMSSKSACSAKEGGFSFELWRLIFKRLMFEAPFSTSCTVNAVILRYVWPLSDFPFKSYAILETIIVPSSWPSRPRSSPLMFCQEADGQNRIHISAFSANQPFKIHNSSFHLKITPLPSSCILGNAGRARGLPSHQTLVKKIHLLN